MQTIDKTKVDEIIDGLLGNNNLTASPEVWYGLHKIKNLQPVATDIDVGDTISQQQAIDAVDAIGHIATMPDGDKCIRRSAVKYTLSMLPPAQPERAEGEWVQIQRCARDAQPDLECPFCKHRIGWWDMGRYCAGCGAKLKGGAG